MPVFSFVFRSADIDDSVLQINVPVTKQLTIHNDGHFAFNYRLYAADNTRMLCLCFRHELLLACFVSMLFSCLCTCHLLVPEMIFFADPLSRAAIQKELDEKQAAEDAKKKPAAAKKAADKDKDKKESKDAKAKDTTTAAAQPPSAPATPEKPKKEEKKDKEKEKAKKEEKKDSKTPAAQIQTRKIGGKKGDKDTDAQSLSLGPFTLSPAVGSVLPGGSCVIDVVFDSHTLGSFLELVDIDISERDTHTEPRILYELTAEGCTPGLCVWCVSMFVSHNGCAGIDTDNFEAIFEEQVLLCELQLGFCFLCFCLSPCRSNTTGGASSAGEEGGRLQELLRRRRARLLLRACYR